jgi:hypothetical protein
MAVTTYKARIRLSNGTHQEVRVQADSPGNAKAMLEAQYGKGNVVTGPTKA